PDPAPPVSAARGRAMTAGPGVGDGQPPAAVVRPPVGGLLANGAGSVLALLFLAPIAWTALSTFKPSLEAGQPPLPPWPTTGFAIENYQSLDAFGAGLWHYTQNSLVVAVSTVIATVLVSTLAGYGFSRFRFPFKNLCFVVILTTIMIPFQSI